jgi:hypothetical protein
MVATMLAPLKPSKGTLSRYLLLQKASEILSLMRRLTDAKTEI